jgi:hypothetical protein
MDNPPPHFPSWQARRLENDHKKGGRYLGWNWQVIIPTLNEKEVIRLNVYYREEKRY